jgi:hypothetical protein
MENLRNRLNFGVKASDRIEKLFEKQESQERLRNILLKIAEKRDFDLEVNAEAIKRQKV